MKAARFMGVEQIEIGEIPAPTPKDDEILAKIAYAGYCGTDMDLLDGSMVHIRNGFTKYPLVPGHEWSGTVVAVGKNVRRFAVGDRVTADVSLGCGCCDYCHHGRYNLCPDREVIGSYRNRQGAFAEYIAVPERHTYRIPDGVSMEEAALAEPAATAAYAVRRSNIQMGDRVLVIGDGPIGQLAAQLAGIEGAAQVIVAGSWDEKLSIARQCGASATINYHKSDVAAEAIAMTDGAGPDVIIESSGNQTALAQAVKALKPGGTLSLISWYHDSEIPLPVNAMITKDCTVVCSLASPNSFLPVLKYMAAGKLKARPLITHIRPLEELEDVVGLIRAKKEMRIKILLKP